MQPPPPAPLALDGGRYRLHEPLGEGGMAVVWRSFDNALQIPCAIKVLNRPLCRSASLRTRFLIEARTMAQLRHTNIVAIQNIGEDQGQPYIVMEMLEGSVAEVVARSGPMPPLLAIEVIVSILRALSFAHSRGVIHRDVKPENVLFSADNVFKLTDFGIARLMEADHSLTRTGTSLGTWGFMAPEQRKISGAIDPRADIYGAGATLFALLVGEPPVDLFAADRDETVLEPVLEALRPIIQKATGYHPADRYPDADAMIAALEEVGQLLPEDADETYIFHVDREQEPAAQLPALHEPMRASKATLYPELIGNTDPPVEPPSPLSNATGIGLSELLDEPEPRSRRWVPAVLGGVLVAGLLLALPRLLSDAPQPSAPPEPPEAVLAEAEPVAAEEPVTEAPPEVVPTDTADTEAAPLDEADVPEEPEVIAGTELPEVRTPAPPPAPAAPRPGVVSISGDAAAVQLKDDSGTVHSAGSLPPGRYVILASFGDGAPFPAGQLTLGAGQRLTVNCSSVFATCTVR